MPAGGLSEGIPAGPCWGLYHERSDWLVTHCSMIAVFRPQGRLFLNACQFSMLFAAPSDSEGGAKITVPLHSSHNCDSNGTIGSSRWLVSIIPSLHLRIQRWFRFILWMRIDFTVFLHTPSDSEGAASKNNNPQDDWEELIVKFSLLWRYLWLHRWRRSCSSIRWSRIKI